MRRGHPIAFRNERPVGCKRFTRRWCDEHGFFLRMWAERAGFACFATRITIAQGRARSGPRRIGNAAGRHRPPRLAVSAHRACTTAAEITSVSDDLATEYLKRPSATRHLPFRTGRVRIAAFVAFAERSPALLSVVTLPSSQFPFAIDMPGGSSPFRFLGSQS